MQLRHHLILTGTAAGLIATGPAAAQSVDVSITVPRLSVAEYHKPYVAVYLEATGAPAKTLSIWYDVAKAKDEGRKWLNEVRGWWRASGRSGSYIADGSSGATRAPGVQKISINAARLGGLKPGQYTLVVEAAREVGGREVIRLPFSWPLKPGQTIQAAGTTELGAVSATFKP
ncbi:DUF2271 domain-containing protein [Sphingomonas sp.]|uniref:DUF2271 domain-containing protein n=1 Tax=Sphingomonas sp. TaxID=28214 RepID=UPI003D6D6515